MRTELLVLLVVTIVAAGFRFYALDVAPPGLYADEAMNGNDALDTLRSLTPRVFYPGDNGREGLYVDLQAVSIACFGNTIRALRFVSALAGLFTVWGTYFLTRRLCDDWRIASLAAFLLGISFWHVNFSRIGFRAIMAPMFAAWALLFLAWALRSGRLAHWSGAGILLGLGMHTYIAFRIMPLVAVIACLAYWRTIRRESSETLYGERRKRLMRGAALAAASFLVVFSPLLAYYLHHPGTFSGRMEQVSVLDSPRPFQQIAINLLLSLGMFVVLGDYNWRHNVAGMPVLPWPLTFFFAVGVIRLLRRADDDRAVVRALLIGWFGAGLLPAVFADQGLPHSLRSILSAPPLYIITALGLWQSYGVMKRACAKGIARLASRLNEATLVAKTGRLLSTGVLLAFLTALSVHSAKTYFQTWAHDPRTAAAFGAANLKLAEQINEAGRLAPVFVIIASSSDEVSGIPVPAEPVIYLTDRWPARPQEQSDIRYLTEEQARETPPPAGARVFHIP